MASEFGRLSIRYAKALMMAVEREVGEDNKKILKVSKELNSFCSVWTSHSQLALYVLSPMYGMNDRRASLIKVLESMKLSKLLVNFIGVLFDRERLPALIEISKHFDELVDKKLSVVPVNISTARAISKEEASKIEEKVTKKVMGTPEFHWKIEPEILGGLIISFDGKIFDASITRRLSKLEQTLRN